MNILVVGGGSIGERHARCFSKINGIKVSICEPYEKKLKDLKEKYSFDKYYKDFADIKLDYFTGVIIATPPNLHVPMAIKAAKNGCHLMIEKPLSLNLRGISQLKKVIKAKRLVCGVAYILRHFPCLNRIKTLLSEECIGRILSIRAKVGSFFPGARPDYKKIYFAKKVMGGGVILDYSHESNYLEWLVGRVKEVSCFYDTLSLDVETEDIAVMLLRFSSQIIGEIHINCFQKDDSRTLEIIGDKGTITCDLIRGRVGLYRGDKGCWKYFNDPCQRDNVFIMQAENFIRAINGKEDIKTTLEEGVGTLKVCMAARESADTDRVIRIR
ncbi:MAG: Gfo/Idh/MocA family oxidoreductase [Nitrospinae bacterium]|nr:Gfo/Idh/MocA family oxidoreductase [Nitrospinota bacterium]